MIDINLVIAIAIPLMGIATMWGSIIWRLKTLEKKMDKHNCLMERMASVEGSTKSAHHRLDRIEEREVK